MFTGTDTVGVVGFECSLDGVVFSSCTSPQIYNSLSTTSHTFQVRAADQSGNTDLTPASFTWTTTAFAIAEDDDLHVQYHQTNKQGLSYNGYACIIDGMQKTNCKLPLKLGPIGDSRDEEVTIA